MQVKVSADINAPASTTWQVFGEGFADISDWLDAVLKSSLDGDVAVGATRTCTFAKDLVIKEKITRFDPQARALTYAITSGLPSFMGTVDNAWTIAAIGDRSRVSSVVTANPAWYAAPMIPLVKISLGKTLRGAMAQLATAVENAEREIVKTAN